MTQVEPNFKQRSSKRKAPTAAALKKKATALHSQYVRARAGYRCERCRRAYGQMQCAHIVSRRYAATRTAELNAWCLCAACHRYLTENPFEHVQFAHQTIGEGVYAALRATAYDGTGQVMKADFWAREVARLTELLERTR